MEGPGGSVKEGHMSRDLQGEGNASPRTPGSLLAEKGQSVRHSQPVSGPEREEKLQGHVGPLHCEG